jgi:hypothetical protein
MVAYDETEQEEEHRVSYLMPLNTSRAVTKKGTARDAQAVRLYATGHALDEICDLLKLGKDVRRAAAAIRRGLGSMARFATDEHREMELRSYDELEHVLWKQLRRHHPLVDRGAIVVGFNGEVLADDRFLLETIDRIMKVKERRAKLLGIDAPARAEVLTIDSVDAEIARLEQELQGALAIEAADAESDDQSE